MRTIDADSLIEKLREYQKNIDAYDKKWNGHRYYKPKHVIYIIDRLIEWIDKNASEWTDVAKPQEEDRG